MAPLPFENTRSIYALCEYALTVEFGKAPDEQTLKRVSAYNKALLNAPFPGLNQTVPAYASLTVFFDPGIVIRERKLPGNSCFEKVKNYLAGIRLDSDQDETDRLTEPIVIPVCYGGEYGPDIDFVAAHKHIDTGELIRLHCEPVYTVAMMGFIPGFAYLTGLDPILITPRKDTPRRSVSAGAVGIGGGQTGIYPLESPGGWQIIGQTPLQLFSVRRVQPSLLKAWERVKFTAISSSEFEMLAADADKNT
jgi:inhibitor of KinA